MQEISLADYTGNPPPGAVLVAIDGAAELVRIYFAGDELPTSTPTPEPDWAAFRSAIAINPAYLRIASHSLTTTVLDSKLTWVLGAGAFEEVPPLWNAIAQLATPTTEEIAALNELADQYQVPFQLNSQGLMGA